MRKGRFKKHLIYCTGRNTSKTKKRKTFDPQAAMEVDPNDMSCTEKWTVQKKTLMDYTEAWKRFITDQGIEKGKFPTENHFHDYFNRYKKQYGFTSLKSLYCKLNKFCMDLYGLNINQWPEVYKYVTEAYEESNTNPFKIEDFKRFFTQADISNPFVLSRGAVIAVCYWGGGLNMAEIRGMTCGGTVVINLNK